MRASSFYLEGRGFDSYLAFQTGRARKQAGSSPAGPAKSWGVRLVVKTAVFQAAYAGSNPAAGSSPVRVPVLQTGSRWFKSILGYQFLLPSSNGTTRARLARDRGSSPCGSTKSAGEAELDVGGAGRDRTAE